MSLLIVLAVITLAPRAGLPAVKVRKMAVLPWNVHSNEGMDFLRGALGDMLTTRLGAEDDIAMARADRVREAMGPKKDRATTRREALVVGKKLGLDYVLYGSVTVIGKAVSLDASLLDVKKGKLTPFASTGPSRDSIITLADRLAKDIIHHFHPERPAPAATVLRPVAPVPVPVPAPVPMPVPRPGGAGKAATSHTSAVTTVQKSGKGVIIRPLEKKEGGPGAPSFWKSSMLKGKFISMAAADLDGNGQKEFFLLEKDGVTIAVRDGKDLRVIQKVKPGSGLELVSVSAVDTDGDGKVEVYVAALDHLTASSATIEYAGGGYRFEQRGIGWLLRKGRDNRGKPILLGQGFRASDGFYGGVDIIKKSGKGFVKAGTYLESLPRGVNLYNFTYFNFNLREPSENYLLAFDKEGRLLVYRKDKKDRWDVYWKSKEYYGGTMNRIEFNSDTSGTETYKYVDVERPLIHMDTDGDGRDELIVRQSRAEGLFRRYARVFKTFSGGSIVSLTWDGEFLTESWRTREINGYIADFLIDDITGNGRRKLVMIVQKDTSIISSGHKSYMLIYDLAPGPPPLPQGSQIR